MASISKRASGAWQNTNYGIRGTATDTITTLPTTIYSDGTNATVSIKGNTTQSGTPTPDNPIMPEGCGELEAGQYKIPISSANTTTPVYLGEVQTTRKIKKLVLTGEEDWTGTKSGCFYINAAKGCPSNYLKSNIITVMCSHYAGQENTNSGSNEVNDGCVCFFTGGGFEMYIGERTITSASDFKAYLQQQYANGTPVCVWYVLAEPETGIVNEPLMKIKDYADVVNNISIPTTDGANALSVDTTIQPSEVGVNYHGWHMGTVHERTAGQWD